MHSNPNTPVSKRDCREEMARPSPDAATIQSLKKRKLALKEEIARH